MDDDRDNFSQALMKSLANLQCSHWLVCQLQEMDGQADSLRVISTSTWKVMGCQWINLWYQLCNRETKENLGECSLHYHSIHETFWYLRTNQTVKQKPHSGWHSGVYMSLGLGHRRAQKLVDEFEIIPYKFFQREPMNFAIGRQLNFLIGLMMIYIYLIWMIFLGWANWNW